MLYVATMKPYDDECLKRIERHRKMRDGKRILERLNVILIYPK